MARETTCEKQEETIQKIMHFVKSGISCDDDALLFFQTVSQIENINRRQNFTKILKNYQEKEENLLINFGHVIEEALQAYESA